MELRTRKTFRTMGVCFALAMVGPTPTAFGMQSDPSRYEFTTQRPGEPPHLWRSMRPVWTFCPATPDNREPIREMLSAPGRLYYVGDDEAGCVDKQSGLPIWRHRLVSQKTNTDDPRDDQREWHIALAGRFLFACEHEVNRTSSPIPFRLYALNALTGVPIWTRAIAPGLLNVLCPVGPLLLLIDHNGTVIAVRQDDGHIAWRRRMVVTHFEPVNLLAADGVGVIQIGAGRLVGFRASDGKQIWERLPQGKTARDAEDGMSDGFALKDGVAYALLNEHEAVAIEAATGRQLWRRETLGFGSPSPRLWAVEDYVLTQPYETTLAALRRTDGATAWLSDPDPDFLSSTGHMPNYPRFLCPGDTPHTLFEIANCDPILDGVQKTLRSVGTPATLIVRDTATGREQWRWQPDSSKWIGDPFMEAGRLYCHDGDRIFALTSGGPDPLPTAADARLQLVRQMIRSLFQWPGAPPPHSRFEFYGGTPRTIDTKLSEAKAQMTLLRLGRDSVAPLHEYMRYEVDTHNAVLRPGERVDIRGRDGSLEGALDLLYDLDDPSTPPELASDLDRTLDPGMRKSVAEMLIRWDDPRALSALFRYVQSGSEERDARQDALYFVCRRVDAETAAGHSVSPGRTEVTAYLLAHLTDPKAPDWLHCFAKFELLNDRGDAAYRAAIATFQQERTARLLPANPTLRAVKVFDASEVDRGFPTEFAPESICRDETGTCWAAFFCNYVGTMWWDRDLWIVQSRDKKHWVRPAFAFNLKKQCSVDGYPDRVEITWRQGRLLLNWTEGIRNFETQTTRWIPHHSEVAIADLYRDSDHDDLPDRLEEEIGTDPHNPDTNGNGVPDNEDKNPAYRPHALTDEEGIYQATIEALCQYDHWISTTENYRRYGFGLQMPFGRSTLPLTLPAPPGSAGVEILGHSGPVLFKPFSPEQFPEWVRYMPGGSNHFNRPHIGLDGHWQEQDTQGASTDRSPVDPFAPLPAPGAFHRAPETFRDYFPYVLSADHRRARVGWTLSGMTRGSAGFDIEVDKISGQWLPVECRMVGVGGMRPWRALLPDAR